MEWRRSRDWQAQRRWLDALYPPVVRWHMPIRSSALQPPLWGALYRLFNELHTRHWSAYQGDRLLGVLTWQSSLGYSDHLWLALPSVIDEAVPRALLLHASQRLPTRRPLTLDFPAGRHAESIRSSGFQEHQTLIWMQLHLD